ncbi:hypothetical protein CEXT_278421, partial [Caerostris extrusa]
RNKPSQSHFLSSVQSSLLEPSSGDTGGNVARLFSFCIDEPFEKIKLFINTTPQTIVPPSFFYRSSDLVLVWYSAICPVTSPEPGRPVRLQVEPPAVTQLAQENQLELLTTGEALLVEQTAAKNGFQADREQPRESYCLCGETGMVKRSVTSAPYTSRTNGRCSFQLSDAWETMPDGGGPGVIGPRESVVFKADSCWSALCWDLRDTRTALCCQLAHFVAGTFFTHGIFQSHHKLCTPPRAPQSLGPPGSLSVLCLCSSTVGSTLLGLAHSGIETHADAYFISGPY